MTPFTSAARAATALALVALLPACEATGNCTPTTTTATDATKVSLTVTNSAVLEARLRTDEGAPLSGRELNFEVLAGGASVYNGTARTAANGTARHDLKRVDPNALAALARGDEFEASFAGDTAYCASSDRAAFRLVR